MSNTIISVDQLKRAIIVAEQIEKLQAELSQILGGNPSISSPIANPPAAKDPRKGKRSPAVRARMAAAQKARWAKKKGGVSQSPAASTPATSAPKPQKVAAGKSIPLSELKVLLEAAPAKTLNVRRSGLQLANLKTLANANPHLLKLGGKGPWPTITMLK